MTSTEGREPRDLAMTRLSRVLGDVRPFPDQRLDALYYGHLTLPIGLFVLLFMSVAIFRRARSNGRSGAAWIIALWIASFGCGMLCSVGYLLLLAITTDPEVTETELRAMLYLPTAIGMVIGVVLAMSLAGRPRKE